MGKLFVLLVLLSTLSFCQALTSEQKTILSKGYRNETNGWIHLTLSGTPYEVGFQHGSLIANEWRELVRVNIAMTYHSTGMTYEFFIQKAVELQKHMIPTEQIEEMQGIADGLTAAGVQTTLNEIIGWNANTDISGYWWPTVHSQYGAPLSNPGAAMTVKGRCSAFVATGSATTNGKIVIGHQSFTEFYAGQFMNVILDITPRNGHRMVFQASPGLIASMTDFWVTGAGLSIVETTIVNFVGYNVSGSPEWVRARKASQFASSIDEWVSMMHNDNNGGYANSWLLADIHSNEIAIFELGLRYVNFEKKTDGFFYGFNAPWDARIRNLECFDTGFNDVRQQTGARRVRWGQLFDQYNGAVDAKIGQLMLGDTYDVYLNKENPSSRTICSHYEVDPQYYVSDPNGVYNVPYAPFGSVDGKLTTADLAKDMSMWGIFGRADGKEFNADSFLKEHAQWNWQESYLKSRPAQPWTLFSGTS